jgi:hypothetical protein
MKSRYYFALSLHTYHLRITNPEEESNSREDLGRVVNRLLADYHIVTF